MRTNKGGMKELIKNPDSTLSIYDNACFVFYVCKYCEVLGLETLLATQDEITYHQKRRVVDFIISTESELNVQESSWKHCLLYLFLNGTISEETFTN